MNFATINDYIKISPAVSQGTSQLVEKVSFACDAGI